MKFIRYPELLESMPPSVITIGHFDGVHVGHQKLISKVKKYAEENNLAAILVTMEPLASQYFLGRGSVSIITPFRTKFKLIKQLELDAMCALNFNERLSSLAAKSFVEEIVINGLNAKHVIVGTDFRFGKNKEGDISFLSKTCQEHAVSVETISTVQLNHQKVSSTQIRDYLSSGDFQQVEESLGRKFSIEGTVIHGQKLGRELGFPTLNIPLKRYKSPIRGVFCVTVKFESGEIYNGAASVGTRPTVNGSAELLEVYLFEFNKKVYGENVEVLFHHKIRNEVKFDSLDDMKSKIFEDVQMIKDYFLSVEPFQSI